MKKPKETTQDITNFKKLKLLFILKRRHDYSNDLANANKMTVATGMYNSTKFIVKMLDGAGISAKQVMVIDNNDIDREVNKHKPTHVIIEGYWVVPKKFDELKRLHPNITWTVRCHSDVPFLMNEGIAFEWTADYLRKGIIIAVNSHRICKEFIEYAKGSGIKDVDKLVVLLENYYPIEDSDDNENHKVHFDNNTFDVGAFGAIRPLKNQMAQAIAAFIYAKKHHKYLKFHINVNRVEVNGESILKNLRAFFSNLKDAELVEYPWMGHEEFLRTLSQMDLCMQVSFSETFNIIAADAVFENVPLLVSSEVPFIYKYVASPVSTNDMANKMEFVIKNSRSLCIENRKSLIKYSEHSKNMWINWLKTFCFE